MENPNCSLESRGRYVLLYLSPQKLNIRILEVETSSLSALANGSRLGESAALWGISKSQQCPTGAPEYTHFSSTPACPQTHTQRWKDTDHLDIFRHTDVVVVQIDTHTYTAVSDSVCKIKTLTWFTIQHVFTPQPKMHTHMAYVWPLCYTSMLHSVRLTCWDYAS